MRAILGIFLLGWLATAATAQMNFNNIESYCAAMSEASTPTLLARTQGVSKSQAVAMMQGMTDPQSIRMVREVIEFAYSRSQTATLDQMRGDLKRLCIERKIFAQ